MNEENEKRMTKLYSKSLFTPDTKNIYVFGSNLAY